MIKKGFTLVELLAVFVVISIIFMIVSPNVFKLIERGRGGAFRVSVRSIVKSGNEYRLLELRERDEKCVYFSFSEDYEIETKVDDKMYIPIRELELNGSLPTEGEMEVCRDYVTIQVSDGNTTIDIDENGKESEFEGNINDSNISS